MWNCHPLKLSQLSIEMTSYAKLTSRFSEKHKKSMERSTGGIEWNFFAGY